MDLQTVVDILNELLAAEQRSLARRLVESTLFVSLPTMEDAKIVRHMADKSVEHAQWLTKQILDLEGVPGLRFGDVSTANLHYQELRHALPRLLRDHEELIRKYKLACGRLGSDSPDVQLVPRILARHQEHHDLLQRLTGQSTGSPG